MCLKRNETGAIKLFINSWTTNQHYPLQSSSLWKPHTTGDVAPTPGCSAGSLHVEVPSAALSRPFGCCPQFQNDDLWGGIWVLGKGISHTGTEQVSMGDAEPLEYSFLVKNSFRDGSVTGSVVVMQHPSVRNLWQDTTKSFSESFKDLAIVLFINCLNLRHEFFMNNSLTVEKKLAWIWFSIWSFFLSSEAVSCSCATPNFVVWFRDRNRKSKIRYFRCVQEGPGTHSLDFPFDRWWNFWNQLCTNFPHAQFLRQNVLDGLVIQIQLITDHSGCQTSIRPHESPHFGHIFVRFWRARSSRTRFVFHTLTAIQKCFTPPKNLCHRYSMLSISPF